MNLIIILYTRDDRGDPIERDLHYLLVRFYLSVLFNLKPEDKEPRKSEE